MAARRKLEEYRRKRDFARTPEPPPAAEVREVPAARPRFMVHKHDATRLHYDLRLEMDGALASWAIPKGPSYDPGQKRLAVQTEDHPPEYGNFEGRIPEGEYGAGDSIIWDRGEYDTVPPGQASAQRKKGHLQLQLDGEKLKGRWHLLRTRPVAGKEQWLLFKAKDGTEDPAYDVVAARPESVASGRRITRGPERASTLRSAHAPPDQLLARVWPPMAAQLSKAEAAPGATFRYEVKYDGYRGLAAMSGGRVAFQSRNALDLSGRFPQISRALSRLVVAEAVVDGEIVALDPRGVSRFELLQQQGADERFMAFDLLWLDGEDLRARPLEERRELLESVLANAPPPLQLAEIVRAGDVRGAIEQARARGLEGLLAKRLGSPYVGTRSPHWLKLKLSAAQELAVVGFTPLKKGSGGHLGALLVAVCEDGAFRYAGKVGTGFTSKMRASLWSLLMKDRVAEPQAFGVPRMREAVWVEPRHVAQIAFAEWTRDGKLRQPSFQGLREDKRPEEAVRERPASPAGRAGRKAAPRPRAAARTATLEVAVTHASRAVFPQTGLTKRDVFEYYRAVCAPMVAALDGRPIGVQQWPEGIHKPGFFRQEIRTAPPWAKVVPVAHGSRTLHKLVVDRPETLLWLANQSALTIHMWSSRVLHLGEPDWVVFDLDPGEGTWDDLIQVATTLRGLLEQLGLASAPKTSGKRGLHVLVPVARGHTHEDAVEFAVAVTTVLAKKFPQIATVERSKSRRHGRLYLDAFQNGWGKTIVAPYSLRAIEGAPASAPLRWSEVTGRLNPAQLDLREVPRRLDKHGDLFAPALAGNQRLPRFQ